MIRSLMKQEVKANYKLYVIFLSIIAMYAVTLVAMYDPSLKDSLKSLEESMPVVLAASECRIWGRPCWISSLHTCINLF